ncbi:MAG: LLM class flavin-dependent oxidoreductase [Dermatophilaceae bacterium]
MTPGTAQTSRMTGAPLVSVGMVLRPQVSVEHQPAQVVRAGAAGLDEIWLWEDCFLAGGIAASATALAAGDTSRLRVGLGLMPVPLRNPALAAMEVAALARLHPGRFVPAFGHGVLDWMAQVGARAESPMTLLEEYVRAVRALLHGAEVTVDGRYVHLDGVALDHPPAQPPPVLVGGRGPKTLALAGALADGVVLDTGTTPDVVRQALEHVARGRVDDADGDAPSGAGLETHSPDDGSFRVVVFLPAGMDAGQEERVRADVAAFGIPTGAASVAGGGVDGVAARVAELAAAGATTVCLQPAGDEPDLPAYIEAAGAVAALVHRG